MERWAEKRLHTLRGCTGQPLQPLDASDDRLASVLQALSDNARWRTFESTLPQQLVRVSALQPERVRLDSTTASGSWAVTPEGLCQFGHSKDHRPDLPQGKGMLSTLAPLGLPLATAVVPGHHADDPLLMHEDTWGVSERAYPGWDTLGKSAGGSNGIMDIHPLSIETQPAVADIHFIEDRLHEYNNTQTGLTDGQLLGLRIRDNQHAIRAGRSGWTWGGCYCTAIWGCMKSSEGRGMARA